MTTGTVLALIFTGITALVAIVSGIWLEARMLVPQPQPTGSPPYQAGLLAGGHRGDLGQPAPDLLIPAAGTTGNGPGLRGPH